ncbi:MAG: serine/threonine-protein kinase, partial [Rhodothermales bacterium]|nr:serine/threonine-protein kinase [Rhodothermales bacterium]
MPFYDGETLDEKISSGPIDPETVIDIAQQTASGLARAHEAGIVHRDIKPANLLVTREGRVKILDFGIAKMSGAANTMTVGILGTLAYMSPEQLEGRVPDERADVWSLGVVLLEMITGSRPFDGDGHPAVIHSILSNDPLSAKSRSLDIPLGIERIVEKALQKDPSARYASMGDLLLDLDRIGRGRPDLVRPFRRPVFKSIRSRLLLTAVVVTLVAFGGLLLLQPDAPLLNPGRSEAGLITDYGRLAVLPFSAPDGSYSERGAQTARQLSQLLNDAGVLTSVDFNAIVSQVGSEPILSPSEARSVSDQAGANFFVMGHEVSDQSGITYAASLYDQNAILVSRHTSTRLNEDDIAGVADQLLFELLQQWELRPYKRLLWSRHLIPSAVRSTSSGAALKEFVLAALRPNEGHLQRATEIDSTFAQAWWIRDIHGYDGSSEETRKQLLRYEHKLPPVERGLMDIYLRRRPEVSVRRQFQALVNEYREDGPLWCEFAEYQSLVNPRFGRRFVDARPAIERCESLTGDHYFRLAQIKLMDGDPSGHLDVLEWEMTRGDSTGRWAWEYEHAMIHAGFLGHFEKIDSLFAIRERFHPFRVLVPAMHLMQHGRKLEPARYIVNKMMNAEGLTEDWYPFALALDAAIDMAAGNVKRGTEKWLGVADDSPEYLPGLVVQRFLDPMPESAEFWRDIVNRVEQWDTLNARGLIGSIDIHSGFYDEVQAFLAGLAGSALDDGAYVRGKIMRLEAIAKRKGASSLAAMLDRTLRAIAVMKRGDVEEAIRLIETSRELYRPPPDSYHSPLAEQLIDR